MWRLLQPLPNTRWMRLEAMDLDQLNGTDVSVSELNSSLDQACAGQRPAGSVGCIVDALYSRHRLRVRKGGESCGCEKKSEG
jgi:hypothetical protein